MDFRSIKQISAFLVILVLAMRGSCFAEISAEELAKMKEAIPKKATAKPAKARKLLVFNLVPKGYYHTAIPYGAKALEMMGEKTEAYEAVQSEDMGVFTAEKLAEFDAICFNSSSGLEFDPNMRKAIIDFVEGGKGIVGIHAATASSFDGWPEGAAIIGGTFDGHPWTADGTWAVKIDESWHPLNAAFEGKGFKINDELYRTKFSYPPRRKLRVLISLDMSDEVTRTAKGIRPGEMDMPLAWIRKYGKGRVFYTSLGHNHHLYWNPAVLRHYLDGVQYAMGDLKADAAPSAEVESGFVSLFNGKDLTGWRGESRIWSVEDGAITGRTTQEVRVKENNYLIWEGGEVKDFELRFKYKLVGGNSGFYFHSFERKPGEKGEALVGPQADFSADHDWTGDIMEYTRRGILAERGEKVVIDENGNRKVVGSVGNSSELLKVVKDEDWNDYAVVARGGSIVLRINGVVMCELEDNDPNRLVSGLFGLQVHVGPPMTVQFKDIKLKRL